MLWLALRYGFIDKSILVVTEGLGPQRFHGRVIILVNEHTASAGEMVAAFAEENQLATILGAKTPGRLLSGSAFKAGFGYIVGLPVAAYLTWQGKLIEGQRRITERSRSSNPLNNFSQAKTLRCKEPWNWRDRWVETGFFGWRDPHGECTLDLHTSSLGFRRKSNLGTA